MAKERDYGFDNIKFVLIFCVVLGHVLEICDVRGGGPLYCLIYLFHMPCFLFLNGYFVKTTPSTARFFRQILRYTVFQAVYLCFENVCLGKALPLQFATPYWLLWFSMASLLYTVLLHAYHLNSRKKRSWAVVIAFFISLLAGFDESITNHMALSRLMAFQPFFLLGFWYRKEEAHIVRFLRKQPTIRGLLWVLVLIGICASFLFAMDPTLTQEVLFRSSPYQNSLQGFLQRAATSFLALVWILFFLLIFKRIFQSRIPLISQIGANTLPVYLLHGFVIRSLEHWEPFVLDSYLSIALITLFCLLVFGNAFCSQLVDPRPGEILKQKAVSE